MVLPLITRVIGKALSERHSKEKAEKRVLVFKILSGIRWVLCRQGLALRRHNAGLDINFKQMLKLQSECDPKLGLWLERKTKINLLHHRFTMS